jgi:hypothetical protein
MVVVGHFPLAARHSPKEVSAVSMVVVVAVHSLGVAGLTAEVGQAQSV